MLIVHAEKRDEKGKGFSRRLRNCNQFPGILYGGNKSSILLILNHNIIFNLQKKTEFYQEQLSLLIQEEKYIVKVQALQRHAFKLKLLHIDFLCI